MNGRAKKHDGSHQPARLICSFCLAIFFFNLFQPAQAASPAGSKSPRIVSTNLCTDQLGLMLAPEKLLSVTWMAADREESPLWEKARKKHVNYGTAEEILSLKPDLVLAGNYTTRFTVGLLQHQNIPVYEMMPPDSLKGVRGNILKVAEILSVEEKGRKTVRLLEKAMADLAPQDGRRPKALVYRAGGFTSGGAGLVDDLITQVGLLNMMADESRNWGRYISMEELIYLHPDVIILETYRAHDSSLANALLEHPAFKSVLARTVVVSIRSSDVTCGTLAMIEAAKAMAAARHQVLQQKQTWQNR